MTGLGTQADPFTVATPADLEAVRNDLGLSGDITWYEQQNDIDMSVVANFSPIGEGAVGAYINYDGQGYSIDGITIESTSAGQNGRSLFNNIQQGGLIQNLNLEDPTINQSFDNGAAPLVATVAGNVENCSVVNPSITVAGSREQIGGLCSSISGTGQVLDCNVVGGTITTSGGVDKVGGFAGQMFFGALARNCWASVAINDDGLGTSINGFVGQKSGGANIQSCFWNTTVGPATGGGDAVGKTTSELQTLATYTDVGLSHPYDMVLVGDWIAQAWKIQEGEYPILGWDDYGTLIPSVTFTNELGSPIVGAHVLWIEETAFAAANPSWNSPVIVSSAGVTDANGVVTYSGTVDPAKVYTAVLRDYEYVNGAWQKSQGSDSGQQNVDLTPPA